MAERFVFIYKLINFLTPSNVVNPQSRSIEHLLACKPYVVVTDQKIRRRLLWIAQRLQFLDRAFAEYFQTVVSSFGHEHV